MSSLLWIRRSLCHVTMMNARMSVSVCACVLYTIQWMAIKRITQKTGFLFLLFRRHYKMKREIEFYFRKSLL